MDYFNKYPGRFELWHIKDKEEIGASGMMDFKAFGRMLQHQVCSMELLKLKSIIMTSLQAAK